MAGSKFNYPMGADEVPRRIKTVQRDSIEASAAVANSIKPVLSYLTGAEGVDARDDSFSKRFINQNIGENSNLHWENYDSATNPSVEITVPQSGKIRITTTAWLYLALFVVDPNGNGAIKFMASRLAVSPEILSGSTVISSAKQGDGPQFFLRTGGTYDSAGNGLTISVTKYVSGLTPETTITVRTRIGYYFAHTNSLGDIVTPFNGTVDLTVDSQTLAVTPM